MLYDEELQIEGKREVSITVMKPATMYRPRCRALENKIEIQLIIGSNEDVKVWCSLIRYNYMDILKGSLGATGITG